MAMLKAPTPSSCATSTLGSCPAFTLQLGHYYLRKLKFVEGSAYRSDLVEEHRFTLDRQWFDPGERPEMVKDSSSDGMECGELEHSEKILWREAKKLLEFLCRSRGPSPPPAVVPSPESPRAAVVGFTLVQAKLGCPCGLKARVVVFGWFQG
ncbi:hypothetical protein Droror1_Dr00016769 [Drosera rotundifolia]